VKKYLRYCDGCGKEVIDLYDFGVTTLYRSVRIGRGSRFHVYQDGSVLNDMREKKPDDYDEYGTGWKRDDDKEFTFCSPDYLLNFFCKAYDDTYLNSLDIIKADKKKNFDEAVTLFQKKHGSKIPFFQKVHTASNYQD
jgi:hypothetical protein